MGIVYLLTGSNSGEREQHLRSAESMVKKSIGRLLAKSSIYITEPWGFTTTVPFLNQVLKIDTTLLPKDVLIGINKIETQIGRIRKAVGYESRIIDIDILLYNELVMDEEDLQIPHPRMHLRKFTLEPLAEIAGELKHPIFKVDINSLKQECADHLEVIKYKA